MKMWLHIIRMNKLPFSVEETEGWRQSVAFPKSHSYSMAVVITVG